LNSEIKLPLRLGKPNVFCNTYAYHATHGIKLDSIKSHGLQGRHLGLQFKTKRNHFSNRPDIAFNTYAENPISRSKQDFPFCLAPSLSMFSYQGPCILKVSKSILLNELNYSVGYEDSLEGKETVSAENIFIYLDNKWQNLASASLGKIPFMAKVLYRLHSSLRAK